MSYGTVYAPLPAKGLSGYHYNQNLSLTDSRACGQPDYLNLNLTILISLRILAR